MNYYGTGRTNYYHVTDEKRYKELTAGLSSDDGIMHFNNDNDKTLHGFGCGPSACWYRPASMNEDFMEELHNDYNDKAYDENGKLIPLENINDYRNVYNADGECIFEQYAQDDEWDYFVDELVKIIPDDECFVYMQSGHEGYRYVDGFASVATKNGRKHITLDSFVDNAVKELLGADATTIYCY